MTDRYTPPPAPPALGPCRHCNKPSWLADELGPVHSSCHLRIADKAARDAARKVPTPDSADTALAVIAIMEAVPGTTVERCTRSVMEAVLDLRASS